ncbi:Twelve cysteine protein 1, partial [Operophtera brumata]
MSEFIQPAWRRECGFELQWSDQSRLTVKNEPSHAGVSTTEVPSATVTTVTHRDLVLNITTSGTVDVEAFKKLLDNLTAGQPAWSKAKARVLTTCLTKPLIEYAADCEINRVLGCTFDVLSEYGTELWSRAADWERAFRMQKRAVRAIVRIRSDETVRPHFKELGILSLPCIVISQVALYVRKNLSSYATPGDFAHKTQPLWRTTCQDLTPSTSCLMSKMGVLNKYGFMDYFQMKDRIRHFTDQNEWSILLEVYLTGDKNATKEHIDQVLKHFHHVFFPANLITNSHPAKFTPKHVSKVVKKPIYDYGVLSSVYVPKVKVIDVKPKVFKKPLTLLPVYMRVPHSNLAFRPYLNDGVLRSPFALHNQIAQAHLNSATPISTSLISPTPISTPFISTSPISTPLIS